MNTPDNTSSIPPTYLCADADDESIPMEFRGYLGEEGPGIYLGGSEEEVEELKANLGSNQSPTAPQDDSEDTFDLFASVQVLTREEFEDRWAYTKAYFKETPRRRATLMMLPTPSDTFRPPAFISTDADNNGAPMGFTRSASFPPEVIEELREWIKSRPTPAILTPETSSNTPNTDDQEEV